MSDPTPSKLSRSWLLFTTSLQVVRQNKKLLLFPLVTFACLLVMAAFFLSPALLYPSGHSLLEAAHWQTLAARLGLEFEGSRPQLHPTSWLYGYAGLAYFVSMFLATFANVAFYHEILKALAGETVSLRAGLRFAVSRLPSILVWSLFAGLVGLIIKSLEERFGWAGRWVMKFVGVVWSVASVFTIPVIVREGTTNPVTLLRNSASLLRKTWGEALIGYAGLTIASWLVGVASLALFALTFLVAVTVHSGIVIILTILAWFGTVLALGYVVGVAGHVYRCALYVYASEGAVPAPYSAEMMDAAWKIKKA